MKVTDLKENECIHCETEEQANAICKLMNEAGLKWRDGQNYLHLKNYYTHTTETCYFPIDGQYDELSYAKQENYKIYKAEQFLNQKKEVMSTVVNINPDTSEINITPKEGFEIDLENSDLKNGKVLLKEVEKKYQNSFFYCEKSHGKLIKTRLSPKYVNKLSILDTLLCLRDEYNRIDGFTESFRFVKGMHCIKNFNGKLELDLSFYSNKIMYFIKEETAKLFIDNFEEQLEQIKEFL